MRYFAGSYDAENHWLPGSNPFMGTPVVSSGTRLLLDALPQNHRVSRFDATSD
jgi:hypothetical protein